MRSTQGDDHTTKKTKGDLNIFPCVGSIMGFTTHIYKLRCKDTNVKESFIGHAAQPKSCQSIHKNKSNYSNGKLYQSIRENGGWDNWSFTVLEKFEYSYDQQLKDKMEEERQFHQPTLNQWAKLKKPPANPLETYIIKKEKKKKTKELSPFVKCECGHTIPRTHYNCHRNSSDHVKYMLLKTQNA